MTIPPHLRGRHHPRNPLTDPKPRMPIEESAAEEATETPAQEAAEPPASNAGTANPHPASGHQVRP